MSYPKDNDDKVRESNKQLSALVKRLRKENEILRREIENIQKPTRVRKEPVVPLAPELEEKYGLEKPVDQNKEEFRKEFSRKYKPRGSKSEK